MWAKQPVRHMEMALLAECGTFCGLADYKYGTLRGETFFRLVRRTQGQRDFVKTLPPSAEGAKCSSPGHGPG